MARHSLIERLEPRVVLNGAPVAVPDPWYSTPANTTLTVTTSGTTLVANDWDPEGSSVSAALVSGPSHGTLTGPQANGTFSYTPTTDYVGFDSFTYRVSDGTANSTAVQAVIAVGGYLGPRTNQDGAVQDFSLLEGSVQLSAPTTPDVTLTYQSATQASAIVVVETSLKTGAGVPSQLAAQLTFNGVAGTSYSYAPSIGAAPELPWWKRPFVIDPRGGAWLDDPPLWDWFVGNFYWRVGIRDAVEGTIENVKNPGPMLWTLGPGRLVGYDPIRDREVEGLIDTVIRWDEIPDLYKQDLVAKTGFAIVIGRLVPFPRRPGVGTFVDLMTPEQQVLYQRYWGSRPSNPGRFRDAAPPGTRSIFDYKISSRTGDVYVRECIYDEFGRRIGVNDLTTHGGVHPDPHYHTRNPITGQRGDAAPGLHPETPTQ